MSERKTLEAQLNDFDPAVRREALHALMALVDKGDIVFPAPRPIVNLHYHTFYSFNGYGYSPSYIVWRARCEGLYMAGCVDFDVLDAVDEFLAAGELLGIKVCAGMETRVYIEEFDEYEMNSPGEPGIAYYVGAGFTGSDSKDPELLAQLKQIAQNRNREIMARVNHYLSPVELDYERDVLPLTPNGNATERHLCVAYDAKAQEMLPHLDARKKFWAEKLGADPAKIEKMFDEPPVFHGFIRKKTMKAGGVGYVQPAGPDYPAPVRVSKFILDMGAIPAYAFVDGLSDGEQRIEELLDLCAERGAAAFNIIPDRNWNIEDPATRERKVRRLHEVMGIVADRGLPVIAGTEMNAYGQKFVDDFDAPALEPHRRLFLEGANIMYAHTVLQARAGIGYIGDWADRHFSDVKEKNSFFAKLGERLGPFKSDIPPGRVQVGTPPGEILDVAR